MKRYPITYRTTILLNVGKLARIAHVKLAPMQPITFCSTAQAELPTLNLWFHYVDQSHMICSNIRSKITFLMEMRAVATFRARQPQRGCANKMYYTIKCK